MKALEAGFPEFLKGPGAQDLKAEYLLPTIIDQMIRRGQAKVTVLETKDKWFGVTYKEDKKAVSQAIRELCRQASVKTASLRLADRKQQAGSCI